MRFVILGSGTGSNAATLLREWKAGRLGQAQPVAIFSDKPDARILSLGEQYGVPARFLDPGKYKTWLTPDVEAAYVAKIRDTGADLVVLAGYMQLVSAGFVARFRNRIVNVHPALLPSFPGLDAIGQALGHGVRVTGVTVHFVDEGTDTGPVIAQRAIEVPAGGDRGRLEAAIHEVEHEIYPEAIGMIARGRVRIAADNPRRVVVDGPDEASD